MRTRIGIAGLLGLAAFVWRQAGRPTSWNWHHGDDRPPSDATGFPNSEAD